MRMVTWRLRASGIQELEQGVRAGLLDLAREVETRSKARAAGFRRSGEFGDSIHVVDRHLADERRPAVFVSSASGDGFWIHSGTNDTPAHPIFTETLDEIGPDGAAQIIGRRIPR